MKPTCTHEDCKDCPERLVCRCLQVTECAIVEVLRALPIRTLRDLRQHTGAGDGCTCCHVRLQALIERHAYASSDPICSCK
jgi:bacterioferritin-associated ferredoxin